MPLHAICRTALILAALAAGTAHAADPAIAKRQLIACTSETALNEMTVHETNKNQAGVSALLSAQKCVVIAPGEPILIKRPGILTAAIEHRGKTLYTRADTIRR